MINQKKLLKAEKQHRDIKIYKTLMKEKQNVSSVNKKIEEVVQKP